MSAQTSKKKRIGSRRSAANQNKTSDADEIHIADSTSVAKSHIPEEHTGSLNLVTNPQNSSPETHRPPSPEHTGHRRKLGSSRKNRGGQHVKELATESYYEAREEVEEKIRGSETPETTQMSLAIQPERKEELCHGREHDMSATHCSTLYSATIPEVQSSTITNCPKADLESLIPKSENLQTDQYENEKDCKVVSDSCKFEETTQGGMDKYTDTPQSEEVKDNAHLGSISVPSYPTVDQQYQTNSREMPEKELSNDSVTEKERKKRNDNTELLTRDGNLQGYYVVSESHIEASVKQFSITPEVTADKSSPREYTELECSIEQEEVLPTDEKQKQIFNLSEVRDAHQSDGAVNKVHAKENKPTEMLDNYYFSESVIHDATENSEIISINLIDEPEVHDTYHSELTVKSTDDSATKQEISNPNNKHDGGINVFDTYQSDKDSDQVKENAHVGTFVGVSKHTSSSLHSSSTVDQQLINQTSSTEMPEEELPNVCSVTEEENKEGEVDTELFRKGGYLMDNFLVSDSHLKSKGIKYSITAEIATEKSSPRENTEPKYSVEQADFSPPKQDLPTDAKQEEILISEVRGAHQLDDTINKVPEQEVEPTEMQDIDYSSESLIPDATENSEIISGNPIDQTEVNDTNQSELTVKSTDDFVSKQEISNLDDKHDDHPETENNFEALDQRNEDYHVHDTKTTQISITERVDTALGQVCEDEGRVEDDIKPSAEQTGHQEKEGVFTKMEESESSLQTLQSGTNAPLDSKPQQTDPDFSPIGNRRKLGSSRKHKGKQHTKDSLAESYHRLTEAVVEKPRDNEPFETTQMSATIETTVQETSMKTMLEGMGTFDTHQTKEDSDQVKENAHVGTFVGVSQHTSSSLHSSSTVDQQLINQTSSTEMPEEELPNVCSVTEEENKEGDVDTELFRKGGYLMDNFLVSDSHLKSKGIKYSITAEITTEKNSPRENTEPKYSVEQADFSPSKQDLPIDAKQEEIFISGVRGAHQLDDTVNKVSEQEVEPTEMQDIDYSSESLIPDATENSEIISGNPIDQTEVNDTNQSELTVKSTDDLLANRKFQILMTNMMTILKQKTTLRL
ncbi:uncharacterized protein LOC119886648 [Micropterus salmoides]|uniref:uncharacterized protein LOC119886648 n=1 Tax=Micropterus salmoides TaxID=27706 RepID=UPI0018EC8FB3|nr:uncharacterized protein LOC119886648 [Micropterus salmoides]